LTIKVLTKETQEFCGGGTRVIPSAARNLALSFPTHLVGHLELRSAWRRARFLAALGMTHYLPPAVYQCFMTSIAGLPHGVCELTRELQCPPQAAHLI